MEFLPQIPHRRIGTPFQLPSWRYDASHNPAKYGLAAYCSKPKVVDAGNLKRLIPKGLRPSVVFNYPQWFTAVKRALNRQECDLLDRLWRRSYRKQHRRKLTFSSDTSQRVPVSWNMRKLQEINDDTFRKLVEHQFGHRGHPELVPALQWYLSLGNGELCRHLHYACYYGMPDDEIARRWRQPLSTVRMLRLLFFDYSHLPVDRLARYSFINQLRALNEIDEQDHAAFRRIFDLGRLGLDSLLGCQNFTVDERRQIEQYLGSAMLDNTLNLRYSTNDRKTALEFHRTMLSVAGQRTNQMESDARLNLLRNQLARQAGEEKAATSLLTTDEVLMGYQVLAAPLQAFDAKPQFPSFVDVKHPEEIEVENTV